MFEFKPWDLERPVKVLKELTTETPNNLPVGISDKVFNLESNTVTQGQCNTIIKLLVKAIEKIEELENKIVQKEFDQEYIARLNKRIDIIEKKQEAQIPHNQPKVEIKDILGPKVNLFNKNGTSKNL